MHSFPLEEVFRYLNPNTVRETLTQALLQSPIFETRWRWSSTLALAVPRNRGGARVPNQLQRMYSEDVLQAVFPDAVACQDNLQGAREIPDHPLVNQALHDALEEAVDATGLERELQRLYAGEIATVARDMPEPSVLSHELLNSAVYTFLDDAPLEERRTRAVYTRRATEVRSADDLGALDPAAIERVRQEAWPIANTPDEMYDALMVAGYIRASELAPGWDKLVEQLGPRALRQGDRWLAHERKDDGPIDLLASRLEVLGPVRETQLDVPDAGMLLLALEGQGRVLRGRFTPGTPEIEWCDRRLLARIHRYTLSRLRAEIEPVAAADFLRFLAHWQHAAAEDAVHGAEGLAAVVEQLEGFELPATAWEHDVLPARVADYGGELIDRLCYSGRVTWGRLTPGSKAPLKTSPIALLLRTNAPLSLGKGPDASALSSEAIAVRDVLEKRGASFFNEIVAGCGLLPALVERALAELAGAGVATADSFAGLRALLARQDKRRALVEAAGRWSLLAPPSPVLASPSPDFEPIARTLLKRYGVVFRALLARETNLPAVARPCPRLPAAGGARRDPRRTLRGGLRRRAVRRARCGGTPACRAQGGEDRRDDLAFRRGPAEPRGRPHARGAGAGDPRQPPSARGRPADRGARRPRVAPARRDEARRRGAEDAARAPVAAPHAAAALARAHRARGEGAGRASRALARQEFSRDLGRGEHLDALDGFSEKRPEVGLVPCHQDPASVTDGRFHDGLVLRRQWQWRVRPDPHSAGLHRHYLHQRFQRRRRGGIFKPQVAARLLQHIFVRAQLVARAREPHQQLVHQPVALRGRE